MCALLNSAMCKRGQCRPVEMGNDLTSLDPVNTAPNCTRMCPPDLAASATPTQQLASTAKYMLYSYHSVFSEVAGQNNVSLFGRPYRIVDYLLLVGLV